MLFRILKKDLKRKKTMNIILFLFIVLATMFVSSGINNVVTVMNGTDYYLDKAGVGDYIIITTNDGNTRSLDDILKAEPLVDEYLVEEVVFGERNNIKGEDGDKLESKNSPIFQSLEDSKLTFFNKENQPLTTVTEGHIYISGKFLEENNLKVGEEIRIEHSGIELSFIIDGKAKDALLGSDFMGNTRFLMNGNDMQKLLDNETIYNHYRGEICYINTADPGGMSSVISNVPGVMFSGARSTIVMCYVMEMIVAFIMLILSICLIIVSFVVLKFSISFTIMEEFREIGVMKGIGLSNGKIRNLYIVKYLMLALIGAGVGFIAGIPFGRLLLKSVSENMVLGNDNMIFYNVLGAVVVVLVIVLFAYLCTGRVKKLSPIDAIRSGQTGERYKKKAKLSVHKCPMGNAFFMAGNDIVSSPKRFLSIVLSFSICTLFVLILVNTTATMKSPNLIHTFGTKSDLYISDADEVMKYMHTGTKEGMQEKLDDMAKELTEQGMPSKLCIELQYKYHITVEGKDYALSCQQGVGTKSTDYKYTEGLIPQNKHEIAITPIISEMTGAKIGDTVIIHYGQEDLECVVTAYFQTMNLLGEVVRLHEDAPTDFQYISSAMHYQINFTDSPSEEEIEYRKERIKELYNNDKVMNATEYCMDCVGVADTMEAVQFMLLGITLAVVILVTILMERSFIADEKSQIAILKAIGFKSSVIMKWHVYRFGLVAVIAVILAAALSIPLTDLCISPIFGMMGTTDINYNIEPLQIFILYPGIILAVTLLVAWITALYTKTIKSSDTANIE